MRPIGGRLPLILLITAGALLAGDRARLWVERTLPLYDSIAVVGEVFRLTRGENTGVAFGLLRDFPLVPWLTFLALLAVAVVLARSLRSPAGSLALGLILGGGLANLIDRLDDGRVTDYLDVGVGAWRYPTFNVPDSAIVAGMILAAWLLWRDPGRHSAYSHGLHPPL